MQPANVNCVPTSTIYETYNLAQGQLVTNYAWQTQPYTTLSPIASGGGICLVMQWKQGTTAMTLQSCNNYTGLLKSTTNGSTWSLDNTKCLVSQLYGKLTTSSGTKSLNSNYLTSMAVALRPTSSTSTQQSTAPLLNHPEMLTGKWELDFTKYPTTVDINGDAAMDFVVHGGGAFDPTKMGTNLWRTSGVQQLDTNPGNDFAKTTIIDLKMQNTTAGGTGAQFALNALRSGSTCAPVFVNLALQADGTQTLTLNKKTNDSTTVPIISITGLPAQPVLLHLIIDPSISAVSIAVNDVQRGTFPLTPYPSSDAGRYASMSASGSTGEFSYLRIRVLEQ
jgi:hypothetical protein